MTEFYRIEYERPENEDGNCLTGPDGFECWITDECCDHTWLRDLKPVVAKLNEMANDLNEIHRIASTHFENPQDALDAILELCKTSSQQDVTVAAI